MQSQKLKINFKSTGKMGKGREEFIGPDECRKTFSLGFDKPYI